MFLCVSVSVTEERQQQKDRVEITEHVGLLRVQQCPLLTTGCIEIQDERALFNKEVKRAPPNANVLTTNSYSIHFNLNIIATLSDKH